MSPCWLYLYSMTFFLFFSMVFIPYQSISRSLFGIGCFSPASLKECSESGLLEESSPGEEQDKEEGRSIVCPVWMDDGGGWTDGGRGKGEEGGGWMEERGREKRDRGRWLAALWVCIGLSFQGNHHYAIVLFLFNTCYCCASTHANC